MTLENIKSTTATTAGIADKVNTDNAKLLQETLDEEEATDQSLTELAEAVVNQEAQAKAA